MRLLQSGPPSLTSEVWISDYNEVKRLGAKKSTARTAEQTEIGRFWAIVAYNTTHVPWQGCSLHDLIQPAFSFLVGAALPFSLASRRARGESFRRLLGHALWRSLVLRP